MRRSACLLVLAGSVAGITAGAHAERLNFKVRSSHRGAVQFELRSENRTHVWPGSGRIYLLEDDAAHAFPINCEAGEHVCYGAWVKGDDAVFWGVGRNNSHQCTKCCYYCDGTAPFVSLTN